MAETELERLRAQRSRFIAFAFAGNDVLVELDADGRVCFCAGAVAHLLGREPAEMQGLNIHGLVDDADMLTLDELLVRLRRTGRLDRIPLRFALPDGRTRRISVSAIVMPESPESTYLTLTATAGGATDHNAHLAGTVSAESFADLIKDRIRTGEASDDARLTLLDLTPEMLAERLPAERAEQFMGSVMKYLRAWSVGGETVGRLENGSLGVLHDGALDKGEINRRLNEIMAVFDPSAEGLEVRAASIAMDADDLSDEDLSKAIVYTMNTFMKEGASFELASLSTGYEAAMKETLSKVATFRRAVGSDSLTLVFQPIVDLQRWQVHHYEALARLDNGEKLLPPARLINFAETFGVVEEMDMAVMKKAFDILSRNRRIRSGAKMAVNLSGRSVVNDRFCEDLLTLMRDNEYVLPRLLFEVTESHEMTDLPRANTFLKKLRSMGCPVCIDDFGAGAAAFPYLKALEVDYVKIDGSYIRDAFNTRHGRPFLRAIAGLAHDLRMQCIGEMVEDEDTMWLLREMGVAFGQGWFFGRPAADVSAFHLRPEPGNRLGIQAAVH